MVCEDKVIEAFNDKHGWITMVLNYDDNRTKYSKNEIRIYEDGVCEIDVYDIYGKYKATGEFSKEDLDTIKQYKWYQDNVGYLSTTIGKEKFRMHRLLFPNYKGVIDHYDNNKLNNTRENLQNIPHSINIAKIKNKMSNKHGVTGISFTISNTWCGKIEINGVVRTKNFKCKEDAILWRYINELNAWGINAPQLTKINEEYPRLVLAMNCGVKISENIDRVKAILKKLNEDKHCPCSMLKNEDTICMCKDFREKGLCHCGIYYKEMRDKNNDDN